MSSRDDYEHHFIEHENNKKHVDKKREDAVIDIDFTRSMFSAARSHPPRKNCFKAYFFDPPNFVWEGKGSVSVGPKLRSKLFRDKLFRGERKIFDVDSPFGLS